MADREDWNRLFIPWNLISETARETHRQQGFILPPNHQGKSNHRWVNGATGVEKRVFLVLNEKNYQRSGQGVWSWLKITKYDRLPPKGKQEQTQVQPNLFWVNIKDWAQPVNWFLALFTRHNWFDSFCWTLSTQTKLYKFSTAEMK